LPNGETTHDEKRTIERKFTDRFTGSDGKKFILSFTNDASRKPIVDDLGASDITKEDFQNVDKLIQQNLYAGHQITAPDLFGIATPGQLGSRQQMRDSYEIFQNTYVNDKQIYLEQIFTELAKLRGSTSELQIIPVEPIGIDFSESVILSVAPKEWILEKLGIDMTKYQPVPEATQEMEEAEIVETKMQFSDDMIIDLFANCGESKSDYSIFKSREVFSSVANEAEEQMNLEFAEQALTTLEANILDLIQKDKRATAEVIAGVTKTDVKIIEKVIKGLEDRGILTSKISSGIVTRTLPRPLSELNAPKAQTTSFMIRYSYEWRTDIPSNQRDSSDHPSRPFCQRLIALDRLYSRAEIEAISARLGYSVFDRRGGWWTMPNGEHSPSCRHRWFAQTVIKKG